MADFLALKGPSETVQRRWPAPVDSDDSAASVAVAASGVTAADCEIQGDDVVLTLSAGTPGTTGTLTVTVTTSRGRVLVETLYIPIAAPGSSAVTARDIIDYAARRLQGLGEVASDDQAADALERLTDMLEAWRVTGADVGATRPLSLTSVIYCPETFIGAIKDNLTVQLCALYGMDGLPPIVIENARRGLALVKNANVPKSAGRYY